MQRKSYELRISDWRSVVCSSDLLDPRRGAGDAQRDVMRGVLVFGTDDDRGIAAERRRARLAASLGFGGVEGFGVAGDQCLHHGGPRRVRLEEHLARFLAAPGASRYLHDRSEEHTSELQSLMR